MDSGKMLFKGQNINIAKRQLFHCEVVSNPLQFLRVDINKHHLLCLFPLKQGNCLFLVSPSTTFRCETGNGFWQGLQVDGLQNSTLQE